nr:TauD/TfdA family dioxygenase [Acinetobacter sp. SFB]
MGAEIAGFKLSLTLDQDIVYEINHALVKYKAIFFKNQLHLTDDEQEDFAALLCKPLNHPTVPVKSGTAHVLELDLLRDRADTWHTDITFIEDYPKASIDRSNTFYVISKNWMMSMYCCLDGCRLAGCSVRVSLKSVIT